MRFYLRSGLAQTKINLADDFREKLDLVKLLVRHSASTFFFQIDGEYTVKRVEIHEGGAFLMPCNEKNTKYKPIPVGPDNDFLIWGVVTWVIKKVQSVGTR